MLERDRWGSTAPIDASRAAKLLVTATALRARRDRPELFTRYAALPVVGVAERHVIAFDRGGAVTIGTRLPVSLGRIGGWGDTVIVLAHRPYRDLITGAAYDGGELQLAQVLERYPVALLVEDDLAEGDPS